MNRAEIHKWRWRDGEREEERHTMYECISRGMLCAWEGIHTEGDVFDDGWVMEWCSTTLSVGDHPADTLMLSLSLWPHRTFDDSTAVSCYHECGASHSILTSTPADHPCTLLHPAQRGIHHTPHLCILHRASQITQHVMILLIRWESVSIRTSLPHSPSTPQMHCNSIPHFSPSADDRSVPPGIHHHPSHHCLFPLLLYHLHTPSAFF